LTKFVAHYLQSFLRVQRDTKPYVIDLKLLVYQNINNNLTKSKKMRFFSRPATKGAICHMFYCTDNRHNSTFIPNYAETLPSRRASARRHPSALRAKEDFGRQMTPIVSGPRST